MKKKRHMAKNQCSDLDKVNQYLNNFQQKLFQISEEISNLKQRRTRIQWTEAQKHLYYKCLFKIFIKYPYYRVSWNVKSSFISQISVLIGRSSNSIKSHRQVQKKKHMTEKIDEFQYTFQLMLRLQAQGDQQASMLLRKYDQMKSKPSPYSNALDDIYKFLESNRMFKH